VKTADVTAILESRPADVATVDDATVLDRPAGVAAVDDAVVLESRPADVATVLDRPADVAAVDDAVVLESRPADVATVLAAENGRIAEYAGKELNDISLDPKEDAVEDSNDDSDCSEVHKETREVGATETPAQVNMKRSRTTLKRKPWSDAEKEAVRSYFAPYIIERKLPGKDCIEEFLKTSGVDRQWTKVKDHIRNQYLT